jgi:hypothetical protein
VDLCRFQRYFIHTISRARSNKAPISCSL